MTLPLALAGPIVRRVDDRHVSVWIALSKPATVVLDVWSGIHQSSGIGSVSGGDAPVAHGSADTRRFGDALFVTVVTARTTVAPLAPGTLHSYDLSFTPLDEPFADANLRSLGLLADETTGARIEGVAAEAPLHLALGYVADRLPGFVTPAATIPGLRFAHASCRKTNAEGTDAMSFLDAVIGDNFTDPDKRPQQLFLTGDQIYADDLGACLLPMLSTLGTELVGGNEDLQIGAQGDAATVSGTIENFPALRREHVIRVDAHFTSTDGANHLLTFGEYAAMYCVAFSPRAWRALATADEVFVPIASAAADLLSDWESCYGSTDGWRAKKQTEFDTETNAVKTFRSLVPKVARAVANVATYMICDDHEVTDDWNLNKQWRNRVATRRLARCVIRNALMAYSVFQAWGNDPNTFTKPDPSDDVGDGDFEDEGWAKAKNGQLLKATAAAFAGGGPFPAGGQGNVDTLDVLVGLDKPDISGDVGQKVTFHYKVPGPRHLVVVLDSRTHRKYAGEFASPPSLLGDTLDAQLPNGPLTDGRELLVVVSPAPVLGPTLIHGIVQPLAQAVLDVKASTWDKLKDTEHDPCRPEGKVSGAEEYDAEGWGGDEVAFEKLIRKLGSYERVVLLSGDVHFASTEVLDFWVKGKDAAASRIVQLTSSGARNPAPGFLRAILRAGPFFQRALQGLPVERLGWEHEASIVLPNGAKIGPGRRARLKREPALVSTSPWPAGTTIPNDKPPDWRWRMNVVRDNRGQGELPVSYPHQDPIAEFNSGDPISSYALIAGRHAKAAMPRKDPLRVCVFVANVGMVAFTPAGDDYVLAHTLLSEATPASNIGAPNTQHTVALARSADAAPQLVAGP